MYNPSEYVIQEETEIMLNRIYETYKKEGDPPAEGLGTEEKLTKAQYGLTFHAKSIKTPKKK